jgi:LPXTG-site transpeptidase (sortase) family protein
MTRKTKRIIVKSTFNTIIICSILYLIASFGPFLQYEVEYRVFTLLGKKYVINTTTGSSNVTLLQAIFSNQTTIAIKPQDPNFDIIIPKIGLNEKIIDNVNPNSENAIETALHTGVGRAQGTAYPNQDGNMYLFAHSSISALSIDRYNAVFTLLRDMSNGDYVYIFYKGQQYTYQVYKEQIVNPQNTSAITFASPFPEITLQTCDPPGFDINRLLIYAKRV